MRNTAYGVAIVALAALPGCGGTSYTTPTLTTTNASPAAVSAAPAVQPRTVKWVDLKAGDCLADPPPADPAVVMVTIVACTEPHQAEAYLRAPIPVNAALADIADSQCAAGLSTYTGGPSATGRYSTTYLIDSEQDRTTDNPFPSTVICLLQAADGKPVAGSARR